MRLIRWPSGSPPPPWRVLFAGRRLCPAATIPSAASPAAEVIARRPQPGRLAAPGFRGRCSAIALLTAPPALLHPPHEPRSRLGARPSAPGGAPFIAPAPVGGGAPRGAAGDAPVARHRPQGGGAPDPKTRPSPHDDVGHDPG